MPPEETERRAHQQRLREHGEPAAAGLTAQGPLRAESNARLDRAVYWPAIGFQSRRKPSLPWETIHSLARRLRVQEQAPGRELREARQFPGEQAVRQSTKTLRAPYSERQSD